VLDRAGLYNEKLVRNQDVELYARIHAAGGRVYLTPQLTTRYSPPSSFGQLLRQTFRGSRWHIMTVMENRAGLRLRHFVPALFVLVLLGLIFLSLGSRSTLMPVAVLLALYWSVGTYYATRLRGNYGTLVALAMPLGCFFFHLVYGLGTLAGLGSLIRISPLAQSWKNPE
jgi:hypothetical protein